MRSAQVKRDFGGAFTFVSRFLRAAPIRMARITPDIWDIDHFWAMLGMLNENYIRANCDALLALMQDFDVVVDSWNPFACIAARALRKPLVTIIQADLHPASRGFIWWKERPADRPTPVPVVNTVLANYRLPAIHTTAELSVGDLTLVVGTPETDPLPDAGQVTYIGPLLWQKPDARLPEWIDALSADKPVIWMYVGNPRYMPIRTWADSDITLRACVEALADEEAQVVLTTGHHALPKALLPLPAHFRYAPYVPGLAMARRSDLLIHHGGYGSCQIGLYTGTPAVIIPTYSERESNARRVAAVGAGDFVLPVTDAMGKRRVRAGDVRAAVRRVLSTPSFAANAKRVSAMMQTYGGAPEAARLILNVTAHP